MSARSFVVVAAALLLAASAPAQVYVVPTFSPARAVPVYPTYLPQYGYADPFAGVSAANTAYNPYTGTTSTTGQTYNPYTGTSTQSTIAYNPYTGATSRQTVSSNLYSGLTTGSSTVASPFGGVVSRSGIVNRFTGAGYSTTTRFQPGYGGVFRR